MTAVLAWGLLGQHKAVIGPDFDPEYDPAHALVALRTYVHEAIDVDDFDRVALAPVNDLAAPGLLGAAREADLLVVGARGMGGFSSLLLGSVSNHCLHHATGPVAVVPGDWTPTADGTSPRIVVAIDGSEAAQQALCWAVAEAEAAGGDLDIVTAWSVPSAIGYPYAGIGFDARPFEDSAQRILTSAQVDEAVAGLARVPARTGVQGPAATAILEHAKDADLIVMGSRGLGAFKGLLLGSTSQQVARRAPCPVVVIRPGDGS